MSKITTIDRVAVGELRDEITAALAEVGDHFGLKIAIGRISFTATTLRATLAAEIVEIDPVTGEVIDEAARRFAKLAERYKLDPTDHGRTFHSRKTEYRIVGLSPSRPKYPVDVVRTKDGRKFKWDVADVRRRLKATA